MKRYPLVALGQVLKPSANEVAVMPQETYGTAGIYSFGRGLFARSLILGSETKYKVLFRLSKDQLVYGRLNAWEGAITVVTPSFEGLHVSQEFPTFDINQDRALPSYVGWICRWAPFWGALMRTARGIGSRAGARRLRVHPDQLLSVEIPLPDRDEQRRVVSKLDDLDKLVRKIQANAGRAETLASSLRWSLLRETFEGLSEVHGSVPITERIEVNPETVDPSSVFPGGSFSYVDIGSVEKGTGEITETHVVNAHEAPSRARRRIRAGDVIVSTVRPNLRGSALVPQHLDGQVCSTGFAVLRPKAGIRSDFLAWQVLSDSFVQQLVGFTRGGHYPAVPDRELRTTRIVAPDDSHLQARVSGRLDKLMKGLRHAEENRRRVDQLREALSISVLNSAFESRF